MFNNTTRELIRNRTLTLFRPGGGGFCPHGLWTFITFLINKLKPPNLVNFPKISLGTIWYSKSLSIKSDVTMATTFWQAVFSECGISLYLIRKSFTFLDRFRVNLLLFGHFLINFGGFWRKFEKSKMADPRWPPFENKTLLWRHMTSSADVADLNGNIFWTYYLSFKFRCHSFNIIGVKRCWRNPPPPRSHQTKKSPVWIGLTLFRLGGPIVPALTLEVYNFFHKQA